MNCLLLLLNIGLQYKNFAWKLLRHLIKKSNRFIKYIPTRMLICFVILWCLRSISKAEYSHEMSCNVWDRSQQYQCMTSALLTNVPRAGMRTRRLHFKAGTQTPIFYSMVVTACGQLQYLGLKLSPASVSSFSACLCLSFLTYKVKIIIEKESLLDWREERN